MVVLALGGITAVLGVLYALMQHDLKRLLAYSTVENIGIIFIGLGLALAFRANGMPAAAALALTAALFHVLNHSLFKSLLFFGAGAVLHATGERDMEQLGGLIHRMPLTALRVPGRLRRDLGPAAAQRLRLRVADVPGDPAQPGAAAMGPASSWCRRSARCWRCRRRSPPPASCRPSASPSSAGRARRRRATAREIDRFSLAAMFVARRAVPAGRHPAGLRHRRAGAGRASALVGATHAGAERHRRGCRSCRSPRAAAPTTACSSSCSSPSRRSLAACVIHRFASRALRRGPAWDCGYPDPSPATQYTADSFAQPIRRVFGDVVFRAREQVDMPPPGDAAAGALDRHAARPRLGRLYAPVGRRGRLVGRPAQPSAVPDHPPLPQPGLRRARRRCSLVLALWR